MAENFARRAGMKRRTFLKTAGVAAAVLAMPEALRASISGRSEAEVEELVKGIVAKLTLDEKIGQMAGVVNFSHTLKRALDPVDASWVTRGIERFGVPPIISVDGPRGIGGGRPTCFPVGMCRGATWDNVLEEKVGDVIGYEGRAYGYNTVLSPCINLLRHPSWGRAQETYGEDPLLLGKMGAAHVTGLQQHVLASPKHFAGNSIENSRFFVNVKMDERTLREIYLPHFKMCVDAGCATIMSAYNDLNGHLCGQNPHLLRDILKGDWGYKYLVISDWVNAVNDPVQAANAGLDLEMPSGANFGPKLKKAVAAGLVKVETIDEAVTRILRAKFTFIKDGDAEKGYDRNRVAGPEHAGKAREVAEKGIVLLKNEGPILPLDRGAIKTLAVVGSLADRANLGDRGSSSVTPKYSVSPLAGIKNKAGAGVNVVYAPGLAAARSAAAKADAAVVVVGMTYRDEGEGGLQQLGFGGDREDLRLHPDDIKLIEEVAAVNPRTIVVVEAGAAVLMDPWLPRVKAVLMAWYPGMEGGNALGGILFGDVNPSGKLPIVFPKSLDQLVPFDNQSKEVEYGYYHGYRWFDKQGLTPLFPFGFGLSYTSYRYESLAASAAEIGPDGKIEFTVKVTNIGKAAGEEVAQLYIGAPGKLLDRPVKDLRGFGRVKLGPGETGTLTLGVEAKDLAYWCMEGNGWKIEPGEYTAEAGASSRDLPLVQKFSIKA
jgi:beta-glucosidase